MRTDDVTGITRFTSGEWKHVAGETSNLALTTKASGAGAAGDTLVGLLVIPTSVSPGAVTIYDDVTTIPVFAGGTDSLTCLVPFFIPLGIKSVGAGWYITTGSGLSVVAVGDFS